MSDNAQEYSSNYLFGSFTNYKAIDEYLLTKNLSRNELKPIHVMVISYLVYLTNMEGTKFIVIENEKFFYVSSSFLKKNLIFLNVDIRAIRIILSKLEKLEIIKRDIENSKKDQRYLKVNSFLIDNWNINDKKEMTASQKMKLYEKGFWEVIVNEFGANEDFEKWILYFDTDPKRSKKGKLIYVASSLYNYCKTSERNQRQRK